MQSVMNSSHSGNHIIRYAVSDHSWGTLICFMKQECWAGNLCPQPTVFPKSTLCFAQLAHKLFSLDFYTRRA